MFVPRPHIQGVPLNAGHNFFKLKKTPEAREQVKKLNEERYE